MKYCKKGCPLSKQMAKYIPIINTSTATWYYNWSPWETEGVSHNIEFIPMIFSEKHCTKEVYDHINKLYDLNKIQSVLIFNEPDLPHQSNMSSVDVVKYWVDARINLNGNIKLSSPVYASLTKGVNELRNLFIKLDDMKIKKPDFIALHLYRDLSNYSMICDKIYDEFNLPIWLTEFAPSHGKNSPREIINWLGDMLEKLNENENIERYAYFGYSKNKLFQNITLYTDDGLNEMGNVYFNKNTISS